mmetsp:Transcript_6414/g.9853  ORF Transcript_6414/g.9853 Transcript_6414/m.9853 type:complete len:271 (-) Transcript_6414:825-1637(-)
MKDLTSWSKLSGRLAIRSGYLPVLSSEFREKILIVPSGRRWIWALSPSYLNSMVNRIPANFSSTSAIEFAALPSIALMGIPGVSWQCWESLLIPCLRRAEITCPLLGTSIKACLMILSTRLSASSISSGVISSVASIVLPPGGVYTTACDKAVCTVWAARPILRFPWRERTINRASESLHATSIFLMRSFFTCPLFFPVVLAILTKFLNTPTALRGGKGNIVRCLFRRFWAMMPRSPISPSSFLSSFMLVPVASERALKSTAFPIPSSIP